MHAYFTRGACLDWFRSSLCEAKGRTLMYSICRTRRWGTALSEHSLSHSPTLSVYLFHYSQLSSVPPLSAACGCGVSDVSGASYCRASHRPARAASRAHLVRVGVRVGVRVRAGVGVRVGVRVRIRERARARARVSRTEALAQEGAHVPSLTVHVAQQVQHAPVPKPRHVWLIG